ncbi:hypothetical protein VR46_04020 [Streptomyces sp. NRRL S-444]|nr:hypothetical protein VR46_04020 [Streptomyces sp. NRRL S-444]
MAAHSIGVIAIQAGGAGSRVIETQPAQAREALQIIGGTSRETLATALRRTLVAAGTGSLRRGAIKAYEMGLVTPPR